MKKYWVLGCLLALAALNLPFVLRGHMFNAVSMGWCLSLAFMEYRDVRRGE